MRAPIEVAATWHRVSGNAEISSFASGDDSQSIVGQWALKRFRFVPRRPHPHVAPSSVVRMTGMALG